MNNKTIKDDVQLLTSLENEEWRSVRNQKAQRKRYSHLAQAALRKDKRINIRISQHDLSGIQTKAIQEGIPYQTLISSIIHKYVLGNLVAQ